jgi:hypothetical protein
MDDVKTRAQSRAPGWRVYGGSGGAKSTDGATNIHPAGRPRYGALGSLGGLAEGGVHHAQRRGFHPFDVAFAACRL